MRRGLPEAGRMTDPSAPLQRIERAAGRGRGVRLDAGETVLLCCNLDLSDGVSQAHFLAPGVERTEADCGGRDGAASRGLDPEGAASWETVLEPCGATR